MNSLQLLIDSKIPKRGDVLFIAIDGRGGSGKSTLAKRLAQKLQAEIIETDNFASWDHPLDWWPLVIERVLEPIKNGVRTLSYPRSKWWPSHYPDPIIDQPVTKVMILEGVSALRKEFRPYIDIGIFVDTPKELCTRRGIERDLKADTGVTEAKIREEWEKGEANEDAYIERDAPQGYADIVVDGTKIADSDIL
jgi:uridine kinase